MDLGLEAAGLECRWQVEINDYARRVLEKNFPGLRRGCDVRDWTGSDIERVDLICGGDPCQANSAAAGGGRSCKQSLGGGFLRVVDELRPRLVLRENPSHIRKDAPWPWWRFRAGLESLGYVVLPFRLRACCLGAFHQRERVFLLAELANADSFRLEGRQASNEGRHTKELARPMDAETWESLYAGRGFGSRAGLPDYVERVIGLGNAVHVNVAEFIGRRIVDLLTTPKGSMK